MQLQIVILGVLFIFSSACTSASTTATQHAPAVSGKRMPSSDADPSDPDYIAPLQNAPPPVEGDPVLRVISWNVKHLGRGDFEYNRAAKLLTDGDVITLQEVNAAKSGVKALLELADELQKITGERICRGISERPSDGKEVYGYLWRDLRVEYVRTDGTILTECPDSALTIRLGVKYAQEIVREPAFATFFFRTAGKAFVLASIHLVPSGKRPQDEVAPLFETLNSVKLPLIVAGDYNLDSPHPVFQIPRDLGFLPAMRGVKTSLKMKKRELNKPYDNFWFRGISLIDTRVINLHNAFPDVDAKTIYKDLSDHSPIFGRFKFP